MSKTVLKIEDCELKFRHEYEPLLVEEKYTKKGSHYDKSVSRPGSALSVNSDKLQKTMISDMF